MKKIILPALLASGLFCLFLSCNKKDEFPDPLTGCDVAEYHLPYYDDYYTEFPFLFRKTFDAAGKTVKEISCLYWNDNAPNSSNLVRHDLVIEKHGHKIFLLNKHQLGDTMASIILNGKGRPESCKTTAELNDSYGHSYGATERFLYNNNRLTAVENTVIKPYNNGIPITSIDTVFYDSYGNVLSFGHNFYQYDYSRKAKKQFYCDDLMTLDDGFYLLQYLGFFPEVNSPVNVRTQVNAHSGISNLTNHQFDAEGKLTNYQIHSAKASINWACKDNAPK